MEIYACKCNYRYPVYRHNNKRKKGHLKKLYCPMCKHTHNFIKIG